MNISRIGTDVVIAKSYASVSGFTLSNVFNMTVNVFEADDTGVDGGYGVNYTYRDENGVNHSGNTDNGFSAVVSTDATGWFVTFNAAYTPDEGWFGGYEDKHVHVTIYNENVSVDFPTYHIGNNGGHYLMSKALYAPTFETDVTVNVEIDWGDGLTDTAIVSKENDVYVSNKRWCSPVFNSGGLYSVTVNKYHDYSESGQYDIMIQYIVDYGEYYVVINEMESVDITVLNYTTSDHSELGEEYEMPESAVINLNLDSYTGGSSSDDDDEETDGTDTTNTKSLNLSLINTDKEEYSYKNDDTAEIYFELLDNNGLPVNEANITPASSRVGNGIYKHVYTILDLEETQTVTISAEKTGYESDTLEVDLKVSEWAKYVLNVSVLTDSEKYLLNTSTPMTIAVEVLDKEGTPVSGVTLVDNFSNTYSEVESGVYSATQAISALPVGRYDLYIKATKTGYKSNISDKTLKTESFIYDGTNNPFNINYPLVDVHELRINDVATVNYTMSIDSYGTGNTTVSDTLNTSDIIDIDYYGYLSSVYFDIVESLVPIAAVFTDSTSISLYGEREMVELNMPAIQTLEEAEAFAEAYFAINAYPKPVYEVNVPLEDYILEIGDLIMTDNPDNEIIAKYINYINYSFESDNKNVVIGLDYEDSLLKDVISSLVK